jgi:hypothetical protein
MMMRWQFTARPLAALFEWLAVSTESLRPQLTAARGSGAARPGQPERRRYEQTGNTQPR